MFTGIITNTATVVSSPLKKAGGRLVVKSKKKFTRVTLGESIAVNGCCLTVVKFKANLLEFDVSDETMRKTALGNYQKGAVVNLERAMRANGSFGGHFVLGHVDGVGLVTKISKEEGSVKFTISYPKENAALFIEKGSVTIDGISLTVCDLTNSQFSVYIIPHTIKETHLSGLSVGSKVNLEYDVIGKYVARGRGL